MKCIYCGSDTKYPDRQKNGGRCAACQHPFAFEPKPDPLSVSDGLFQRVLKDVSAENTVFFTERQLWYEFNRRVSRKMLRWNPWSTTATLSGVGGVGLAIALASAWPVALGVCGVVGGAAMSRRFNRNAPNYARIEYGKFLSDYLSRWVKIHGPIEKLLPPLHRDAPSAPPSPAPDVAQYSFDRALVTDDGEIAAMLVANNFHFENNCAVLSVDGYPPGITDTVLTMLRRNPQLTVFALHDASEQGLRLTRALRGERWFPDTAIRLIDLGLRPAHARKMTLFLLRGERRTLADDLRASLSPEEAAWLESGSSAELAALRPAKLMRAVYQGFARANQIGADGVGIDSGPGGIWLYNPGADVYAADSFG